MEKPLPPKQFKRSVKQKAILGLLGLALVAAGAFLRELFIKSKPSTVIKTENTNNDSASSNTVNNTGAVTGTQNNAGRDNKITENKKVVEIKKGGTGFFDSAKQFNNNTYTGVPQRHIDLELMKKIIDSIPNKKTRIQISAGGDGEGENLGNEIRDYLVKFGFQKAEVWPWAMTGNYEITEYHYDKADSTFRIDIHPQRNDKQLY